MIPPPHPSTPAEKPAATKKWTKAFRKVSLILRLGSPNRSYELAEDELAEDELAEAPAQDPPATANSLGYVVPSPPTSPFNPAFGPIPEGKEARSPPKRGAYVSPQYDLGPQPKDISRTPRNRSPYVGSNTSTPNSMRSRINASPASARTHRPETVPRAFAGRSPETPLPPEQRIQKAGLTDMIARIFVRGNT